MTGPPSSTRAATASYTVTVSEDPRFVDTVRDLTARTAELVDLSVPAAARLAAAVEHVVRALAGRPMAKAALAPRLMEVRYDVGPEALRVEIACEPSGPGPAPGRGAGGASTSGTRTAWTLETWLAAEGALDALRTLAPDVELSVADAPCTCRFTSAYSSRL